MTKPEDRFRVTGRDIELLVALYRYRCLNTAQVRRLFFPSEQTSRRRLHHLAADLYVRVLRVPGIGERVVVLARRGAELVAGHLGIPPETVTYATLGREIRHPFFLRHHIQLTDFRLSLEHECRASGGIRLLGFLPEYLNRRADDVRIEKYLRDVVSKGAGKLAHVPDGVFAIERNDRPALFFVEIDRGTEVVSRADRGVLKGMRFYLDYLRSGGYQRYTDDFDVKAAFNGFRLLFVTTSTRRIENIRRSSGELDDGNDAARRFLWLAHKNDVGAHGILQTKWASLDPDDKSEYTISPHDGERA